MTRSFFHRIAVILMVVAMALGMLGAPAQAAGGSYTINFAAADPKIYIPPIPFPGLVTPIVGRGNGEAQIPKAWFKRPGGADVRVESLAPESMALCQVVPFEIKITVTGSTAPENGAITFVAGWSTVTTSGDNFGYDPAYGVYAAFIDTGDGAYSEAGTQTNGPATVSSFSSAIVGTEIQGTFNLTGLDNGDVVVMEAWLVLDCTIPAKATGNVQSRLISARTATGDAISTGNQTVPLLRVGEFTTVDVNLQLTKTDDNIWKALYVPFWYDIVVSYPTSDSYSAVANAITVTDTLDPWTRYLTAAPYTYTITPTQPGRTCSLTGAIGGLGGTLTCYLGAMVEGDVVTIRIWVQAEPTVYLGSLLEVDNTTSPTMCTQDTNPHRTSPPYTGISNGVAVDTCNKACVTTISEDKVAADNCDDEPKDIRSLTAVDLLWFTATGQSNSILLGWETATETNNLGFNIYRSTKLDGSWTKINAALIPTLLPPGSMVGAVYSFEDLNVLRGKTYYYWLEDVEITGATNLNGPVSAKLVK